MKLSFIFLIIGIQFLSTTNVFAQNTKTKKSEKLIKPYHPEDDAAAQINALLIRAKKENKNVILQAGGNWCVWCLRFDDFRKKNKSVRENLAKNYLYYHLNYSNENKNQAVFDKYVPEGTKLGYPFFIILSKNGEVLKLQESGSFENGITYDAQKVIDFLDKYKN
ncbi:thioredoxin family protein [Flavobacterium sp. I3-2]|uniref:thioredoxin family protein n=1 Tax=Flavobacterium sp. I3-2 TaxID=2748319 RepID=UPI0015B01666|nr:thioredoxin family protein [Flavobacterium sp. I3-2]